MPQTFYIESDEEIISVIGRLRHSSNSENYFIFPKRALVLQSIINLKLFQREAEKLGKRVIIVTQDEVGMMLAEKVGLPTERYTDDFSRQAAHLELAATTQPVNSPRPEGAATLDTHTAEDLGSNDFYTTAPKMTVPVVDPGERILRVRNASPLRQTSLNSQRLESEPVRKVAPTRLPATLNPAPMSQRSAYDMKRNVAPPVLATPSNERGERLRNFFGNGGEAMPSPKKPFISQSEPATKVAVTSRKVGGIFLFLGSVSLLSLIGVLVFLFLPRAEVHVVPYKMTQNVDLQFEGRLTGTLTGAETLPVRVIEKEQTVNFSVTATGVAPGTAQKARGTVVISNTFSTDPQSLVATTRLESADGKVFRLIAGVTVPGMVGGQAGVIEAAVIADQSGIAYNIAGTKFTVPGFKGSPKFDKFSAQSNKAMTGGSDATGSGLKIVSKEDIEKADIQAQKKAKEDYLSAVAQEIGPGEKILEENIDLVSLPDVTPPLAGMMADSFEYRGHFKVRGFVFPEAVIKEKIMTQGEETMNGLLFRPVAVTLTYGEATPDFGAQTLRLKVHALVDAESVINQEKLIGELLGKNGDGINAVLASFPEIKKIQIVFKPPWFTSVVPAVKSRVTITVDPGSSE